MSETSGSGRGRCLLQADSSENDPPCDHRFCNRIHSRHGMTIQYSGNGAPTKNVKPDKTFAAMPYDPKRPTSSVQSPLPSAPASASTSALASVAKDRSNHQRLSQPPSSCATGDGSGSTWIDTSEVESMSRSRHSIAASIVSQKIAT